MARAGKIGVIKRYFEEGEHGRKVTIAEVRPLIPEERLGLADLAAVELKMIKLPDGNYCNIRG